MAYLSPQFQAVDKTTDREKMQQQFRAQLLGLRPKEMDKSSFRRRADSIAQGGQQATAYEIAKRTRQEQDQIQAARQAMLNSTSQNINTSVGQGQGPSFNFKGGGGSVSPGGNTSFDQFMNSISSQESGGNYHAVNGSSGAMGKYQIMPGNLPSWSRQAVGRSVSRNEFLNSPQLQEAIARHQMQQYYSKWGPRGAAIAWYAGPGAVNRKNLNAPQGSYPSISDYAAAVLRRLGL